jgi:hypothetical protein
VFFVTHDIHSPKAYCSKEYEMFGERVRGTCSSRSVRSNQQHRPAVVLCCFCGVYVIKLSILISKFCPVLNVVFFLLRDYLASELFVLNFRDILLNFPGV